MPTNEPPAAGAEEAPLSARAERKLAQVIDGARSVIVAKGFEGASVDDIAREAGISKATMYRYFPDKTALFEAVMSRECQRQAGAVVDVSGCCGPIETTLMNFATGHLTFILSDTAVEAFRAAVAESARFPDVARTFHEGRLRKAHAVLAPLMAAADQRGELSVDDPEAAASLFLALCKADLFFKRLFGVRGPLTAEEIAAQARQAVQLFLRVYRPR